MGKVFWFFFGFILGCPTGFYGVDCSETCGNCRDIGQCDRNNGSCLTGCDAGYKGDLCRACK